MRLEDIFDLKDSGLTVKVSGGNVHIKGRYIPKYNHIQIFINNNIDEEDYNLTIIHEFIHAVYPEMGEGEVEMKSRLTKITNPEYLDLIKETFNIPKYINARKHLYKT